MKLTDYDIREAFRAVLYKLNLYNGRIDTRAFWDEYCEVHAMIRWNIPVLPDED